jgi:enoyl-CoA hydratase
MSLVLREHKNGVAVLTMDRPRANAFNPELVADLRRELADAREARAVVLASSQKLFSGGWDLPTIVDFERARMEEFVSAYTDLIRYVFSYPAPVVAALNGHAIAGGLILAAAADERIAAEGKGTFGLSEVNLGVPVPNALYEIFRYQLGERAAERLAVTGENVSVERALQIGLVDEVVAADRLLSRAVERGGELAGASGPGRTAMKRYSRAEALERFDAGRRGDGFLDAWFSEEGRRRVGDLVDKLTARA